MSQLKICQILCKIISTIFFIYSYNKSQQDAVFLNFILVKELYMAHLRQKCHNSKCVIFKERPLKVLKCHNFLWVQRRNNCSPAASVTNCVLTLYLLKLHLQTFLSIPITQKGQILSCDTLVANERYVSDRPTAQESYYCTHSNWYLSHKLCLKEREGITKC